MSPSVMVVIREDPQKTHRAVEALRIALGLSTGENPLTVALLDQAPLLLTQDLDDVLDIDVIEKYLPSLKQLEIPFLVPTGARARFEFDPEFKIREAPLAEIAKLIASSDRVLSF